MEREARIFPGFLGLVILLFWPITGFAQITDDGCAITEIRLDKNGQPAVLSCADDNTLDFRDRSIPDIGQLCDLNKGEDCLPFLRKLWSVSFDFLGGLEKRRVVLNQLSLGMRYLDASGNIAFREQSIPSQSPAREIAPTGDRRFQPGAIDKLPAAVGYGHWSVRRLENREGKAIGEWRTLSILKARFRGGEYYVRGDYPPAVTLEELRDMTTGEVIRRLWSAEQKWFGKAFSERTVLVYASSTESPFVARLSQKNTNAVDTVLLIDQDGKSVDSVVHFPKPAEAFSAIPVNYMLAGIKKSLAEKEPAPSPTTVAGDYRTLLERMPAAEIDTAIRTAITQLDNDKSDDATATLLPLIASQDDRSEPELLLGLMFLEEGELTAADSALGRAFYKNRACWRCLLARSVVLERLGRESQSAEHLKLAAKLAPGNPEIAYYRARRALASGDEKEARNILDSIFDVHR